MKFPLVKPPWTALGKQMESSIRRALYEHRRRPDIIKELIKMKAPRGREMPYSKDMGISLLNHLSPYRLYKVHATPNRAFS